MHDVDNIVELGLDIGSTTVKGVILDSDNRVLWQSYERHRGHQSEVVHALLTEVQKAFPDKLFHIAITGSGARTIAPLVGGHFIQEVNAVTLAVETYYPEAGSVIELGGQDAKVILWKGEGEARSTLSFMNDKCAGGTGSTIDKIMAKLGLSQEEAAALHYKDLPPHHISAKCGVFAETDVVGLVKAGVCREEIFISLCTAVIQQNLEVLVKGNILRDKVLLLGGPNQFISTFAPLWRKYIRESWDLHGYVPAESDLEKSVIVPENAHYFAAKGAVLFHRHSGDLRSATSISLSKLQNYIEHERGGATTATSASFPDGLVSSEEEAEEAVLKYGIPPFVEPSFNAGDRVVAFLGLDGGSTSTKLVLINEAGKPIYRDYRLSSGNPLEDTKHIFTDLSKWISDKKIDLQIEGAGATGYAAALLKEAFSLDSFVVETVAHMNSATDLFGDVDVICDVGGQDIKVLFMKHGQVVDFKLNTQCSAGNGFFLQSMAEQFSIPVEEYAKNAFKARRAPKFNYGCAVFMEQDKVNFQQAGWTKEEMMAGLALVLPLNIWQYVVQESNLAKLGTRFVLQGGTQKNLAAAKSQVDYIINRIPQAQVHIHPYADIGGAIGAALEVRNHKRGETSFIGVDAAKKISFKAVNDETTICSFCTKKCRRTLLTITREERSFPFITGYSCEKGSSLEVAEMVEEQKRLKDIRAKNPNLVQEAADAAFATYTPMPLPHEGTIVDRGSFYSLDSLHTIAKKDMVAPFQRGSMESLHKRKNFKVAIPRLLNMFYYTPFFSTYLRALGVESIEFSDWTSAELWREGNKWGAIDPCFPAKVAPAHIWNIFTKKGVDAIFFPIITHLETNLVNTLANTACVIQMGTPEVVEALFTRDRDMFKEFNVQFWDPAINMDRPVEVCGILFEYFKDIFDITPDENAWAVNEGRKAQETYLSNLHNSFERVINNLIDEDRMGLLMLGHPYHNDPGLNHGIPAAIQEMGYPVFPIEALPLTEEFLKPLFADEVDKDPLTPFDIRSLWERNFNRNTNHKIWAAKIASKHPNIAVVDLSSFKCGHDAPTYTYIDEILDATRTAHFLFHDIDQNKPGATFKIRLDTIDYFLKQEEERLKIDSATEKGV